MNHFTCFGANERDTRSTKTMDPIFEVMKTTALCFTLLAHYVPQLPLFVPVITSAGSMRCYLQDGTCMHVLSTFSGVQQHPVSSRADTCSSVRGGTEWTKWPSAGSSWACFCPNCQNETAWGGGVLQGDLLQAGIMQVDWCLVGVSSTTICFLTGRTDFCEVHLTLCLNLKDRFQFIYSSGNLGCGIKNLKNVKFKKILIFIYKYRELWKQHFNFWSLCSENRIFFLWRNQEQSSVYLVTVDTSGSSRAKRWWLRSTLNLRVGVCQRHPDCWTSQ